MADYQMAGYYEGETQDEYERRKRREAEEQAQYQTQDQESGGVTAERPSTGLMDVAGRYVQNRLGQAQQRVTDAGQMFTDPEAALQRRMGMPTTQDAANTEVQSQQVKTYADGSQEEITKKQLPPSGAVSDAEQQASLAAPRAPVAPQTQLPPSGAVSDAEQQANRQAPVQPARPVSPEQQAQQEAMVRAVQQPQNVPAVGPSVQVASTDRGAGVAEAAQAAQAARPVAPAPTTPTGQAQVGAPQAMPNLSQGGAQAQATPTVERETEPLTPEQIQRQTVVDTYNERDPVKRERMMAEVLSTGDPASKQMIRDIIAEDHLKEKNVRKAIKDIEEATPTQLASYMKDRNKEGSYVKAILFARLGLNDLAKREQELLNPDLKMDTAVVGTDKYTVVRDDRGGVVKAFDVDGREVGQKTLAKISAAAMPTKAFLLPQSGGGLMQKTIIGPDGKEQVITGQVFTDPQTRETYFQAGNTKYDTTGLSTPAQNVQNVYNAAGARKQGEITAETGTSQGALKPMVSGGPASAAAVADSLGLSQSIISGTRPTAQQQAMWDESVAAGRPGKTAQGNPIAKPGTSAHENANAIDFPTSRATAEDLRKLREAGFVQTLPKTDPNHWERTGTGGVTTTVGGGGGQRPGEPYSEYVARVKRETSAAEKAAGANIELGKEERSNFLTYEEKDIIPKADASASISRVRKQQLKGPDGILNNPEIVGIMSGQGPASTELANLIRDTVTGGIKDDELSRRVNALGLTQRQRDLVYNQLQLNNTIAPETLKANAGPGSVSDAEQRANKVALVDITRVPLYTAATMLHRDMFEKDTNVARQTFRNANPNLTTVRAFNDAWGKEKERLQGEYDRIYEARAKYIGKYYQDGKNPLAITEAYKQYPVPEFSRDGGWNYGTDYARNAAKKKPPIGSFDR